MTKFFTFIIVLICLFSCQKSTQKDHEHKEESGEVLLTDCNHCGMPALDYPQWNTYTVKGQEKKYFCSSRCLFIDLEKAPKDLSSFKEIMVTDYYTTEKIQASHAWFVINSDVLGPMGRDFVALNSEEAARDFVRDHQGEIVRMIDIDQKMILKATKN